MSGCVHGYELRHNTTCDECVDDLKERIVVLEARLRELKTLIQRIEEQNRDLKAAGACCEKPDYTGYAPCKSCGFDPTQ